MGSVPGWPVAFRGSAAIAAGLVTKGALRGPAFERLFPDTYVPAPDDGPPGLALRAHAAYRYVEDDGGVLSGTPPQRSSAPPAGGWRMYRYTKFEIRHRPELIVALLARARERPR
jgi:hypothetical protein